MNRGENGFFLSEHGSNWALQFFFHSDATGLALLATKLPK